MLSNYQKKIIIKIISPFDPSMIGFFGSYARGDNKPNSDLDLLVNFNKRINLLELIGLEQDLSEKLGIKVDLITDRSVNPKLRPHINNDLQLIYQ